MLATLEERVEQPLRGGRKGTLILIILYFCYMFWAAKQTGKIIGSKPGIPGFESEISCCKEFDLSQILLAFEL